MIAFLNLGIESANHFETNFTRHTVPTLFNAHERTFVAAAAAACAHFFLSARTGEVTRNQPKRFAYISLDFLDH